MCKDVLFCFVSLACYYRYHISVNASMLKTEREREGERDGEREKWCCAENGPFHLVSVRL